MENPLKFIHINNDETNRGNTRLSSREKRQNRSRTVAVLALSPTAIRKLAMDYTKLTDGQLFQQMAVGVQVVSLEDNYNKKIGRDLSVGQMKEVDLEVIEVVDKNGFIKIRFATHEQISLTVILNKKTGFSTVYGRLSY